MIYITGDTHAEFNRFSTKQFPEQKDMTKDDYVIICGDFGGIWTHLMSNSEEEYWLKWLSDKPFTILFVDGNHENFDRLKEFPRVKYHGGIAHRIRPNIYHLMRGYVFEFEGKKFFTFGGAKSHDIRDGILDLKDYDSLADLVKDYNIRTRFGQLLRINQWSWWKEELPSAAERERGIRNLEKVGFKVDYVITHCLPGSIVNCMYPDEHDCLNNYFDSLINEHKLQFKAWHAGHYHQEKTLFCKYHIHFKEIERLL